MDPSRDVEDHYGRQPEPVAEILKTLTELGFSADAINPNALSGVDEFHLGGRFATLELLNSVRAGKPKSVLDVGCGIGGPARTIAAELEAQVVGVDLTPSFIAAATELTELVGMADQVSFEVGDAVNLDQPNDAFDLVTLFHVGMNIADKPKLFTELARVVRPGGEVLVYDIMRIAPGRITMPVPWASSEDHSHLASLDDYLSALIGAGLEPSQGVDHRPIVRDALERSVDEPPLVNLTHLMGAEFSEMFANVRTAVGAGLIAPFQIVATKPF